MTAAHALKSARAVGICVHIDGDDLELEAPAQPPQAVLDLLSLHKADILRLLRPADDGWSPEDWQVFFDERAGILEFDAGMPRAKAEARAFVYCLTELINRNPTRSAPGRCLACGGFHDWLQAKGEYPNVVLTLRWISEFELYAEEDEEEFREIKALIKQRSGV